MRWTGETQLIGDNPRLKRRLAEECHRAILAHEARLTELDRAIGDADHGANMLRGFAAILADADRLAGLDDGEALTEAGRILVMTVGGASGPLYGTLLMDTGRALTEGRPFAEALAIGVAATARRGKAERGDKTLIDVLMPLADALLNGTRAEHIPALAASARDGTTMMLARRGRAAFLGARSIGHIDPGAESAALLAATIVAALSAEARS